MSALRAAFVLSCLCGATTALRLPPALGRRGLLAAATAATIQLPSWADELPPPSAPLGQPTTYAPAPTYTPPPPTQDRSTSGGGLAIASAEEKAELTRAAKAMPMPVPVPPLNPCLCHP